MIEYLTSSAFAFIGTFVAASLILGVGTDWVRRQQVRDRHKVPGPDLGKTFYAENEHIAKRALEVLSDFAHLEAEAIRPHDKLDDDLDLDIGANPDLFFALERAFGIDCEVDKFEVFEATTAGLDTVSDVIAYVAEKVEEAGSRPAPPKREERRIDGVEIIGIAWFVGLAVMVTGSVIDDQRIMSVGLIIAFLPLTFGLGRVLAHVLKDLVTDVRELGMRETLKHPFSILGWILMFGTMLAAFAVFCLILLSAFGDA